jgi:hypothetical protein
LRPTRTEDSEAQNKDHDLSSAIERTAKDVNILPEPSRVVSTQPNLADDADDDGASDDRVDTSSHPLSVLIYNRKDDMIDFYRTDLRPSLVCDEYEDG